MASMRRADPAAAPAAGVPRRARPSKAIAVQEAAPAPSVWHSWGFLLLVAFAGWMWLQSMWAVDRDVHGVGAMAFTKFGILYAIMFMILRSPASLEFFAFAHAAGCTLWGWTAASKEVSGRYEAFLGPGVDDSNMVGIHMITGLAMAGFLFLITKGKKRWIAFAMVPLILNTIILTASRSAQLGLVVAGIAGLILAPKQKRLAVGLCGALGLVLLLMLAQNDVFWDRAATIQESVGDERGMESSAASRWVIADANLRMAMDYPLGAGYRGNETLSAYYIAPEFLTAETSTRSAHNTFLAILVDQGIPGAIIFVVLVLWGGARLTALLLMDRHGLPPELGGYRAMIGAGLAALLVSGQFVNALRLEVAIWLIAMLAALDGLCQQWRAQQDALAVDAPIAAPLATVRRPARPVPQPRASRAS
jgi:hypothetical protein